MQENKKITIPVTDFQPTDSDLEVLSDFDNQRYRFSTIVRHRRSRKTTLGLNQLIRQSCRNKNRIYAYISPTYKQAKSIIVRDPMMLHRFLPRQVLKKDFNETELVADFLTNSVLMIKGADNPESLLGIGFYGVVLDEFALMKREIWERILEPVLRENGGWAWFIFTPKGRNFAYEIYKRGEKPIGQWKSYFLDAEHSNLISKEELENARQSMPARLYQQELMCEFLEDAASVFHGIEKCITGELKEPEPGRRYVIGVDLGKTHDWTVLVCMDAVDRAVVAYERFNQIEWSLQKQHISAMAKKYNNAYIVIDTSGFSAGDPIEEDLRNWGLSTEGFKFTAQSKKVLIEQLIVAIEQRLITFPHIEQLITELKDFTYRFTPKGHIEYTAPDGEEFYDDCVIALGLAVQGIKNYLYLPARPISKSWRDGYKPDLAGQESYLSA